MEIFLVFVCLLEGFNRENGVVLGCLLWGD